jgi:hypothetical protein
VRNRKSLRNKGCARLRRASVYLSTRARVGRYTDRLRMNAHPFICTDLASVARGFLAAPPDHGQGRAGRGGSRRSFTRRLGNDAYPHARAPAAPFQARARLHLVCMLPCRCRSAALPGRGYGFSVRCLAAKVQVRSLGMGQGPGPVPAAALHLRVRPRRSSHRTRCLPASLPELPRLAEAAWPLRGVLCFGKDPDRHRRRPRPENLTPVSGFRERCARGTQVLPALVGAWRWG